MVYKHDESGIKPLCFYSGVFCVISMCVSSTVPTSEEAEGAASPLVQVHVVRVDVADEDAVVVVVQVVAAQHVELPPHRRHDMVHSPL